MQYLSVPPPPLSQEEIDHLNAFWASLPPRPKPSPYKPAVEVKVKHTFHISKLRDIGHKYLDMIWRDLKLMQRNELYLWLAGHLGVSDEKSHFSRMNEAECIKATEACIQLLNDNRRCDLDFGAPEPTPYFELIIT